MIRKVWGEGGWEIEFYFIFYKFWGVMSFFCLYLQYLFQVSFSFGEFLLVNIGVIVIQRGLILIWISVFGMKRFGYFLDENFFFCRELEEEKVLKRIIIIFEY